MSLTRLLITAVVIEKRPVRPKATPGNRDDDTHDRVRHDRVDKTGKITLRYHGRLYSIGIGRTHARTHVVLLVCDLDIRVVKPPPENCSAI